VGDTVRCPWHHACFSLRSGEAVHTPAFDPLTCWDVEQRDSKVWVRERASQSGSHYGTRPNGSKRIVIVGGGAAGFAAAEMLRRQGYQGSLVIVSSDAALPYDRPNLSKDHLAGTIPFDYTPLRSKSYYAENHIETRLGEQAVSVDVKSREVILATGNRFAYDRLLLATGAEPVWLTIPGADQPHVRTLRSLADCQAIIDRAQSARRVIVVGASFIGLEVAAALRARNLEVNVVAPERRPMERILGPVGRICSRAARGARSRISSRKQAKRHRESDRKARERRYP
jgi:NADPH-dependent 2,4-dienoyl-CoA reductase/sulfur reductase-like enzyme